MGCKSLDGQVARRDPQVAGLLDKFVCVRIIQANGMDLALFQFDYGLTWSVFFLNADQVIYGRYGSRADAKSQRSAPESAQNVTIEGMKKALEGALELHKGYPANKATLAGKSGPAPRFKTPEEYPLLKKFKPTIEADGKGCMHCHQIWNAERKGFPASLTDKLLYPYPMPDKLGLVLDRKEKATVKSVTAGSAAEKAGFQPADEVLTLAGQPILSIADVQWVLHNAEPPAQIAAVVNRNGKKIDLKLALEQGWRKTP